jgi:6-phosphogluconolactonase
VSRLELRVVDDLPGAAIEQFLETSPRTIALTGGSTPEPVYERLAEISYPWEEVEVFMGDERCVPPDHPDSNYGMAKRALLDHVNARTHPPPYPCDADAYERELRSVFGDGVPRFDLIHLGIGPDGHTASLFPGKPALEVEDRLVTYVPEPGRPPPHPRLTFTFPVLRAARVVTFMVSGEDKRVRIRELLAGEDIPAARVTAERVIVLADVAAAEGLESEAST